MRPTSLLLAALAALVASTVYPPLARAGGLGDAAEGVAAATVGAKCGVAPLDGYYCRVLNDPNAIFKGEDGCCGASTKIIVTPGLVDSRNSTVSYAPKSVEDCNLMCAKNPGCLTASAFSNNGGQEERERMEGGGKGGRAGSVIAWQINNLLFFFHHRQPLLQHVRSQRLHVCQVGKKGGGIGGRDALARRVFSIQSHPLSPLSSHRLSCNPTDSAAPTFVVYGAWVYPCRSLKNPTNRGSCNSSHSHGVDGWHTIGTDMSMMNMNMGRRLAGLSPRARALLEAAGEVY